MVYNRRQNGGVNIERLGGTDKAESGSGAAMEPPSEPTDLVVLIRPRVEPEEWEKTLPRGLRDARAMAYILTLRWVESLDPPKSRRRPRRSEATARRRGV